MSEMRQGMETWLNKECQSVGQDMLYAVFAADAAQLEVGRLMNPALQHPAIEGVENLIRNAVSHMTALPLDLLTADERRVVFKLKDEIEAMLKEAKQGQITNIMVMNIGDKVYDINMALRKYLLEKVVECQCGKPGIVHQVALELTSKDIIQNLIYLDEVYKRINTGSASPDDIKFKDKLLTRFSNYEIKTGKSLKIPIDMATKGEFCPWLYEKLK